MTQSQIHTGPTACRMAGVFDTYGDLASQEQSKESHDHEGGQEGVYGARIPLSHGVGRTGHRLASDLSAPGPV